MKVESPEKCNLGQGSLCCAYLICGPEGFECAKGTGFQPEIDERLLKETMKAKGTGEWESCLYKEIV